MNKNLLIVDDEPNVLRSLNRELRQEGYTISLTHQGKAGGLDVLNKKRHQRDPIPVTARIVTLADVFDSLTHDRPYKEAWPVERALAEMKRLCGSLFDPEMLEGSLEMQQSKARPIRPGAIRWH